VSSGNAAQECCFTERPYDPEASKLIV
jgi:hypothetical protein